MSCLGTASIMPLVLPIAQVSLPRDVVSLQRGIEIELGNPPQTLSFLPSLIDDAMAIANPNNCINGSENSTCSGLWGGLYEANESKSYSPISEQLWSGSHSNQDGRTAVSWFNEEMQIAGKSILGYPVTQYDPATPSTSWGMWAGSSAVKKEVTGSLIIGGYDKARVLDEFTNFTATTGSLACMYLKALRYNTADGSDVSLLQSSSGEPMTVCASPEILDMEVPSTAFNALIEATNAEYLPEQDKYGWPANTPLGNISLEFFNGFKAIIPGEELWQPHTGYDASGRYTILNDSITISRVVDRKDGLNPNLGFPFFASVYMTFYPEENRFALATPIRDSEVSAQVVSFCNPDHNVDANTRTGRRQHSHVPTATIVGATIGGVAGLIIIGLLLGLSLRRSRKADCYDGATVRVGNHHEFARAFASELSPNSTQRSTFYKASELADTQHPSELSASSPKKFHELSNS